jgi:hypothetical protein
VQTKTETGQQAIVDTFLRRASFLLPTERSMRIKKDVAFESTFLKEDEPITLSGQLDNMAVVANDNIMGNKPLIELGIVHFLIYHRYDRKWSGVGKAQAVEEGDRRYLHSSDSSRA